MSHVTRNASHVTHHTSHVTRHRPSAAAPIRQDWGLALRRAAAEVRAAAAAAAAAAAVAAAKVGGGCQDAVASCLRMKSGQIGCTR